MRYLKEINTSQLTVEKGNKSDHLENYLDLTSMIESGNKLSRRLYDKRDDFDFEIVNFPFLPSSKPSCPSYGVYISQLIRYMQDAANIMMILDIATSGWLIDLRSILRILGQISGSQ